MSFSYGLQKNAFPFSGLEKSVFLYFFVCVETAWCCFLNVHSTGRNTEEEAWHESGVLGAFPEGVHYALLHENLVNSSVALHGFKS